MRSLEAFLRRDLHKKMILLAGPRQVGKSTFAKGLLDTKGIYLNWDLKRDKREILEKSWPKDASLVVLDEIHKYPRWKNHLKGIADEFENKPPILVTGSARLDAFRRGGDALTGRHYLYRLHPLDVAEARLFAPRLDAQERLERLLRTGGFPEAFLNPRDAARLRNDRHDLVVKGDVRDLSRISDIHHMELLVDLLRERVASGLNYSNIAQDLSVSSPTVKSWIDLLEELYVVFRVYPWSQGTARSLRKEPKLYFMDCASAVEKQEFDGARLENLVACALLKYCDFMKDTRGEQFRLWYFRDREGREVDFVVTKDRKPYWCIEVKRANDTPSPHLRYLKERLQPSKGALQLVGAAIREREVDGIRITSAAKWLDSLASGR